MASRTLAIFDEPFVIQEQPLQAIGSLGIALYPHHSADAANVLRQADSAMYLAKRDRLSFLIWDESMSETAILAVGSTHRSQVVSPAPASAGGANGNS